MDKYSCKMSSIKTNIAERNVYRVWAENESVTSPLSHKRVAVFFIKLGF